MYELIKSKDKYRDLEIEKGILEKYNKKYKVFVSQNIDMNAFATGIIPFSKTILLGKETLTQLNANELNALVAHEVAHHKYNHLMVFFILNVLVASLVALIWLEISPNFKHLTYYPAILGLYFGISSSFGSLFLIGLAQKRAEKQADAFAAKNISKEAIIGLLHKLYESCQGKLEKFSWNYPTLQQRIDNVLKS